MSGVARVDNKMEIPERLRAKLFALVVASLAGMVPYCPAGSGIDASVGASEGNDLL